MPGWAHPLASTRKSSLLMMPSGTGKCYDEALACGDVLKAAFTCLAVLRSAARAVRWLCLQAGQRAAVVMAAGSSR
jgi:hypothetical protein